MEITRRMHNLLFDLTIACCLTAPKWLEKPLWSWPPHLASSNWSRRLQKPSQNARLAIAPELSSSVTSSYRVVLTEISVIYDQSPLWTRRIVDIMTYCFCSGVGLHTDDLAESNCCIMNAFDETFHRLCFDFYLRNSAESFSIEIKKSNLLKPLWL